MHESFMPHGMCFLWRPDLLALHVVSDAIIGLAYFSIPVAIFYFGVKRRDFSYRWVLWLFAAFIVACGGTHFFGIWTLWHPDYYAEGALKVVTALVSAATAVYLWPLIPRLLAVPSPADLRRANDALSLEIRERIKAQRELEAFNESLEATVASRTTELARSNRELESFARIASHDLKAPLRAIKEISSWIEEDLGPNVTGESGEHLTLLRGRVGRMQQMLDDLLAYSRVRRDPNETVTYEPADAIVRNALAMAAIPTKFELEVDSSLQTIEAPRMPLQQIVLNLVSNAVKHHDKSHGVIGISAHETADGVHFTVYDDGPGIPERHHERIFEMFQTLKPRDEVEGSGVGLAIVKKYVDLHDGVIAVESTPGEGTRFTITWPPARSMRRPRGEDGSSN